MKNKFIDMIGDAEKALRKKVSGVQGDINYVANEIRFRTKLLEDFKSGKKVFDRIHFEALMGGLHRVETIYNNARTEYFVLVGENVSLANAEAFGSFGRIIRTDCIRELIPHYEEYLLKLGKDAQELLNIYKETRTLFVPGYGDK